MTAAYPKLRDDLTISRQYAADGTAFVVKDPVSGRFFRLKEPEYFLATRLDGHTSLATICHATETTFGAPVSEDSLAQFVDKLRRIGLLENRTAASPPARRKSRVQGNLLALRIKAFDPDRLFGYLDGKVRFFFTPWFVVGSAVSIVVALAVTVTNTHELGRDLQRLFSFQSLLAAWLMVFIVTTAHEFAHGIACKRFGGEVHEVGFLLIYLQPAFYCNVTDAWLFPEKSKRLWVTFAGAYLEVFLWAAAILIWRITEPGTGVSHLALVVMATSGIKTLFNLNPLIKLDGYYLLSDALGVPNLRQKAFQYLRGRIMRRWASTPPPGSTLTRRERRIFVAYGVLAGTFSIFLLGLMIMQIGGYLISEYQGIGFIMFAGVLAFVARGPLGRAVGRIPRPAQPGTRVGGWWTGRAKALLLVLAVAAALFLVRMDLTVSGEFKILPSHMADVRADVEGIIESIEVAEGARVNRGAVVARLSQRDAVSELRKTEAEIGERQAKLGMLLAGPRGEEITLQRDAVVTARTRLEHARNRQVEAERIRTERRSRAEATIEKARERSGYAERLLHMHQSLFQRELIAMKQLIEAEEVSAVRKKELEEAEAELKVVIADDLAESRKTQAVAEKELREAESKLKILLAGSRPEEIDGMRAELARFETQRRYREEQMQLATVVSPIAGIVTTPKLKDKVGQHVKKGDLIAEVQQLRTVTAEISVPEAEIGDIRVGQPVTVKARAYPERSFGGLVSAIGAAATKDDGRNVVKVTTAIDNPDDLLKAELTGHAKIRSDNRSLAELVTRRIARYLRVEFWSWW